MGTHGNHGTVVEIGPKGQSPKLGYSRCSIASNHMSSRTLKINIFLRIDLLHSIAFQRERSKVLAEQSLEEGNHPVHFTISILTKV